MNKYTCILIEDEPLASEKLETFIGRIPFLQLQASFKDAIHGLDFLLNNKVDIVFLDIQLHGVSGIELLQHSRVQSQVILTSAFAEYALQGYELRVTDYLLKPFTFNRFLQAVNTAQENIGKKAPVTGADFIFVKTENRLENIAIADILYIEGMRDYRKIHTTTKKIMTLQNFSELQSIIPENMVCRVHKSFMVALSKIESIERGRIKVGNKLIPLSDTYRDAFFRHINNQA